MLGSKDGNAFALWQKAYSVSMSAAANECLEAIKQLFVKAGAPEIAHWHFDAGKRDQAHDELASLGLLFKVFGTERGFAWQLTMSGYEKMIRAERGPLIKAG